MKIDRANKGKWLIGFGNRDEYRFCVFLGIFAICLFPRRRAVAFIDHQFERQDVLRVTPIDITDLGVESLNELVSLFLRFSPNLKNDPYSEWVTKFNRHIKHGHIYEVADSEVQGWSYVRPEESNSVCRYPTRVVDLKVASDDLKVGLVGGNHDIVQLPAAWFRLVTKDEWANSVAVNEGSKIRTYRKLAGT